MSSDYPLWWLPVSVLVYLVLHDTWFYWTHRWMHRPRLFKIAHAVHHASRPPTAWAAMSFHPLEAVTGAVVIPVLVFVVPIHIAALGVVLAVMTLMGVTNHMGWEMFPETFGAWTGRTLADNRYAIMNFITTNIAAITGSTSASGTGFAGPMRGLAILLALARGKPAAAR